jgi:hypothetical protein
MLQRVADFVGANPQAVESMLAVALVGVLLRRRNRGWQRDLRRWAFLLATDHLAKGRNPQVDFETFLDPEQLEEVGLKHQYGKLTDSTRTLDP